MSLSENKVSISKHIKYFFDFNEASVNDTFTLQNLNKVYIKGILLKITFVAKQSETEQLNDLLIMIQMLEHSKKYNLICPPAPN